MKIGRNILPLLGALLAPVVSTAQEDRTTVTPIDADSPAEDRQIGPTGYELAENLVDRQVFNATGQEIGELSNIIVRGDRITHAIISIGGFVGIGGSEVVVPFEVLRFTDDQITIQTIATVDQMEGFTPYDPDGFGISK